MSNNISAKNKNTYRWAQLVLGIICMSLIANLQYGWTLFVNPLDSKYGWGKVAIQVAFSIFILTETWLVPFEGYLVDRFGPAIVCMVGGLMCGVAWVLNSYADSLTLLYIAAAIGGIGAGAVYGTSIGNAVKWFPDRRGLAVGLAAAGYGAGSALTIIPIAFIIKSYGYEHAFFFFGILQGLAVFVIAYFLTQPKKEDLPPLKIEVPQTPYDYSPWEMLLTPTFWLLYFMFVIVGSVGLMAVAQLAPIAHDLKIADVPVSLLGITLPALTFALTLDRITNGLTRPFFGWVSDKIGREITMFIAFGLEGLAVFCLYLFAENPLLFVLITGLVFFGWGEIFSLFPSTCTDTFGSKFATTNAGLLYTAKGTASLLVPLSTVLAAHGGWSTVFLVAVIFDLTIAILALALLRPMRAWQLEKSKAKAKEVYVKSK